MIFIFVLLVVLPLSAMQQLTQELKAKKLYAADFKILGIEYLERLRTSIDTSKIIPPKPYSDNEWKHLLEAQQQGWEQQIDSAYHAPVYLKYINSRVGFGVFADEPIEQFQTIGEYTGLLCADDGGPDDENLDYAIDAGEFYAKESEAPVMLYVNAVECGNYTRFINHSYLPNVDSHHIFNKNDGLWHVLYRANKDIPKDFQLLVSYGENYWNGRGIEPIDLTANP